MSRSPLFRKLTRLIQQADFKNRSSEAALLDSSRRQFIKSAVVTSAALIPAIQLLNSCTHTGVPLRSTASSSDSTVVILGAGIAGLTAAYYLTKARVPCVIYEASSRVGGRMFTKTGFNADGMTCELGGELIDSDHSDILQLCSELGVAVDDFTAGDAGLVAGLYFFNQKHYTDHELIPLFQPFAAKLRRDQLKIKSPKIAKAMDHLSLDNYLKEYKNVEPWILDMIRVAYVGEMGLESSEQSALGLISNLGASTKDGFKLYGDSDECKKIRGGNIALTQKLEDFLTLAGVSIYKQMPALKIQELSSGMQVTLGKDSGTQSITAKKLICTIPFSILRHIDGVSAWSIDPLKKKYIQTVGYGTNGKMMIGYQDKIWRDGIKQGSLHIPACNGLVFTNQPVQNIWETSRTQKGNSGILTSFTGGHWGAQVNGSLLNHSIEQINQIFPGTKVKHDNNSVVMNWTKMPFHQGSYASMKLGQTVEFENVSWTTELSGQLLFAGEHVADKSQGFMNGGCRSGKKAAAIILENSRSKKAI